MDTKLYKEILKSKMKKPTSQFGTNSIYYLFSQVINHTVISSFGLYLWLIVLESFMLLILPIDFLKEKDSYTDLLNQIFGWINYPHAFGESEILWMINYLFFWVHGGIILFLGCSGFAMSFLGTKGLSNLPTLKAWISSLINLGLTLLHTVLLLPMLFSFLTPCECFNLIADRNHSIFVDNSGCWGGLHIAHLIFGFFFAGLTIAIYFLSLILFYEDYYFSPLTWSGESHNILFSRGVFRFLAVLYMCLDPGYYYAGFAVTFLWLFLIYLQILIFTNFRSLNNPEIQISYQIQEGILFSVYSYCLLKYFNSKGQNILGIAGVFLLGIFIGYILYYIKQSEKFNNIFQNLSQIKTLEQAEIHVRLISWLVIWQKGTLF